MTPSTFTTPTETDILRFCVALCEARNDEDKVGQVIKERLAGLPGFLHAAFLTVTVRVVVAQFLAPAARRLDHELGFDFVDAGLRLQSLANDGLPESVTGDTLQAPTLTVVPKPES
ncbi:hypothetical protein IMZ11_33825 [Microtetraspora sp. AC03309]|uniref:hypothetical protein n=1 Tax=Microtetraspora sp. AC03309 TaxID=2779376 RepID=UPI001E637608|nr:hypothetical protein [Microtetraspora sp. AC03309]MCC5580609.1 hypothetical protein [Microtetraspora sp. AC03309]